MNSLFSELTFPCPSDLERRQIFFWLKKTSSATAWRRIFRFYKDWADITEKSIQEADAQGWNEKTTLPESDYVLILKSLAHCEEGVIRLEKGDKRVFKFDANGEFAMASRILNHWLEIEHRIKTGDNGVDEAHTPFWHEFCQAMEQLANAWRESSVPILERRYLEDPAPITYNDWLKEELIKTLFSDEIGLVPDPAENIFIKTHEVVPVSGIWEPIQGETKKSSLLTLFSKTPKPQPPFIVLGSMNYLHGGSDAPQITLSNNNDSVDLDTTWRLLWRDDRYLDGTLPTEELSYMFANPEITSMPFIHNDSVGETVWAESGTKAPVAGKWLVESDLNAKVTLEKGALLPLWKGREVRWILAFK